MLTKTVSRDRYSAKFRSTCKGNWGLDEALDVEPRQKADPKGVAAQDFLKKVLPF